jgi:hypothetical protein
MRSMTTTSTGPRVGRELRERVRRPFQLEIKETGELRAVGHRPADELTER